MSINALKLEIKKNSALKPWQVHSLLFLGYFAIPLALLGFLPAFNFIASALAMFSARYLVNKWLRRQVRGSLRSWEELWTRALAIGVLVGIGIYTLNSGSIAELLASSELDKESIPLARYVMASLFGIAALFILAGGVSQIRNLTSAKMINDVPVNEVFGGKKQRIGFWRRVLRVLQVVYAVLALPAVIGAIPGVLIGMSNPWRFIDALIWVGLGLSYVLVLLGKRLGPDLLWRILSVVAIPFFTFYELYVVPKVERLIQTPNDTLIMMLIFSPLFFNLIWYAFKQKDKKQLFE